MLTKPGITLTLSALIAVCGGAAKADPPATFEFRYLIRETPTNPQSDVVFIVVMRLKSMDQNGNSVGWEIDEIEFRQPDGSDGADTVWTATDPDIDSQDGLWWITHADADDPQLSEFDMAPYLKGTATAEDATDDDLDYEFEGVSPSPPPEAAFGNQGFLDYIFTLVGQQTPIEEGDDEPVHIVPPPTPPA